MFLFVNLKTSRFVSVTTVVVSGGGNSAVTMSGEATTAGLETHSAILATGRFPARISCCCGIASAASASAGIATPGGKAPLPAAGRVGSSEGQDASGPRSVTMPLALTRPAVAPVANNDSWSKARGRPTLLRGCGPTLAPIRKPPATATRKNRLSNRPLGVYGSSWRRAATKVTDLLPKARLLRPRVRLPRTRGFSAATRSAPAGTKIRDSGLQCKQNIFAGSAAGGLHSRHYVGHWSNHLSVAAR